MPITLSVITPVYNGSKFIAECIENVIAQQCHVAEHLILDACSADGTVAIIRSYAERYPHIRLISEKDQGQSDAMNKGVDLAKGSVIGFLNVDDYYEPDVLNRVVARFACLPEPSLLVGNCRVLDAHDNLLFMNRPAKLRLQDIVLAPYINPWPINPAAYFYHRSLHEKAGLYDIEENYALDLDFLLRAVQVAQVTYVDETWGNFRFIEGTKTFNDTQVGANVQRFQAVLDSYRKDLPPTVQQWFQLFRAAVVCRHWLGYLKAPKLFFRILAAKIRRRLPMSKAL
jgi:glycosyltransferase involved in cell wall biosynthesis